jgi:protein-S-isoprenylcysteine O-methyltransferase Ste14
MSQDETFRVALIIGAAIVMPVVIYYRIRSITDEKLDRWQEGTLILFTMRPLGLAAIGGLIAFMIHPASMAWSSLALPGWLRWSGIGLGALGGSLLMWTLPNLGRNLTDTVVTRKSHTLVLTGPYRWIRHPFYVAVVVAMTGNALAAANWFVGSAGILFVLFLVARTRREEERLLLRFGDAYRAYVEATGRFLPKLSR